MQKHRISLLTSRWAFRVDRFEQGGAEVPVPSVEKDADSTVAEVVCYLQSAVHGRTGAHAREDTSEPPPG